jgi:hypothetical protein
MIYGLLFALAGAAIMAAGVRSLVAREPPPSGSPTRGVEVGGGGVIPTSKSVNTEDTENNKR